MFSNANKELIGDPEPPGPDVKDEIVGDPEPSDIGANEVIGKYEPPGHGVKVELIDDPEPPGPDVKDEVIGNEPPGDDAKKEIMGDPEPPGPDANEVNADSEPPGDDAKEECAVSQGKVDRKRSPTKREAGHGTLARKVATTKRDEYTALFEAAEASGHVDIEALWPAFRAAVLEEGEEAEQMRLSQTRKRKNR